MKEVKRPKLQKLKLFYIADCLMRKSDEQFGVYIKDIQEYLADKGIEAEYHSISNDIAILRDDFGMDIAGGGGKGRPYQLVSRHFDFSTVSMIAECIGAAKFISEKDANLLIDHLKELCSEYQASKIDRDYFVAERPRETQRDILDYLKKIRDAIEYDYKISFLYRKTTINSRNQLRKEYRREGNRYVVSPFRVVLSEGNYYLICFDIKRNQVASYRIDRMEEVSYEMEQRVGEEKVEAYGINDYARQTFGMFLGPKAKSITLLCNNDLLDTMIERFGTRKADYKKVDDKHFTITTDIVVSPVFYGWLFGFQGNAIIQGEHAEGFRKYLETVIEKYK